MEKPLISIIIPVYNAEKTLKKCIKSIISQTYSNLDIILIDDGSKDESLKICKEYSMDNRVRIITKENSGLSKTRQLGIDLSFGEFFCTVDSDDYIESKYIELMYKQISKTGADICICESYHHSKKTIVHKKLGSSSEIIKLDKKYIEQNYFNLTKNFEMSDSWNKMYNKKFVLDTNVKFSLPSQYKGNDLLFNNLLLLKLPNITIVNVPLYNYIVHDESLSRKKNKLNYLSFIYIMDRICEEVEKCGYSKIINIELSKVFISYMYMSCIELFKNFPETFKNNTNTKKFLKNVNDYITNNHRINYYPFKMSRLSFKIFSLVLCTNNDKILFLYLRIRNRIN